MASYFVDSSAIVKRYIREHGTAQMVDLVRGVDRLAVARIALVEVTSALVRRSRGGDLQAEVLEGLLRAMEDEFRKRFEEQPLSDATLTRSVDVARTHALRAADSIQLASALQCAGVLGSRAELTLVSADQDLIGAAQREGLTILDPTDAA